jgi:hypothetical protein
VNTIIGQAIALEVMPGDRRARGRRFERHDTTVRPTPTRFEHGIDAEECANIEYYVPRLDRLAKKLEQRRFGLVRHEMADAGVDSHPFVVNGPRQT